MIELLVSILIFAFGMLGLIGLQTKTLGYSQVSLLRSQAATLTGDMMDRLRADRSDAIAGQWQVAMGATASDIVGSTVSAADRRDWLTLVAAQLPQGQASVDVNASGVATITIQWLERGKDPANPTGNASVSAFTTTTSL